MVPLGQGSDGFSAKRCVTVMVSIVASSASTSNVVATPVQMSAVVTGTMAVPRRPDVPLMPTTRLGLKPRGIWGSTPLGAAQEKEATAKRSRSTSVLYSVPPSV